MTFGGQYCLFRIDDYIEEYLLKLMRIAHCQRQLSIQRLYYFYIADSHFIGAQLQRSAG